MEFERWTGRLGGAAATLAVVMIAPVAGAATMTWDGDGPGATWSALNTTPGPDFGRSNWIGALLRPANGDDLVFAGSRQLDNVNDYPLLSVRNLGFAADAGPFKLGGNSLLLQGDIVNASARLQTLELGLTLTGASTWDGGSGGLDVRGAVNIGDTRLDLQRKVSVNTGTRSWVVGDQSSGSLALGGGSTATLSGLSLANRAGSTGQLDLAGNGTRLAYADALDIGRGGSAFVTLTGGAVLDGAVLDGSAKTAVLTRLGVEAGSRGQIVLSGAGTRWQFNDQLVSAQVRIEVGGLGEGRVLVEDGALLQGGSARIGTAQGGHGVVSISGTGSAWRTPSSVSVGWGGTGEINILNGAEARLGNLWIGNYSAGQVTVSGAGSRLDLKGTLLEIGGLGQGRLDLTDGAQLVAPEVRIAGYPSAPGDWFVKGSGTLATVNGELRIGEQGTARLSLSEGAALDSQQARLGGSVTSFGVAEVLDGGEWRNAGNMAIGHLGGGQLIVGPGGQVTTASLELSSQGRVDLVGGSLRTGSLSGAGRLTFSGGTLRIDQDSALGTVLPAALTLAEGMRMDVGGTLTLGAGSTLTMAGGRVAAGLLRVDGGRVSAGSGVLDLAEVGKLQARGAVGAAIAGSAASIIEATGPLTLGDASRADGFLFDGVLMAGGQRVELQSSAAARLGLKTTLEAGAELVAEHGLMLAEGARLVALGDAAIDGRLLHDGTIASIGGTLTLRRGVSGAGGFDGGSFAFVAGLDTGSGFADIDFGGATAIFGQASTLTLKIGHHADRLSGLTLLDFEGTLQLDFDPGVHFASGASLQLLDFEALDGGFDPGRIVVSGIDASRLDFTRLGIDGTLHIAAVPEPAGAWTLAAGLFVMGGLHRRRRAGLRRTAQGRYWHGGTLATGNAGREPSRSADHSTSRLADAKAMKPIWWTITMGRGASTLALLGAVLVSTPASATPVFISGLVEAKATAQVGSKPQVVDQQSQAIVSVPANAHLDVSAYAESLPGGQGTQVSARMLIDAAWDAAELGRVNIQQSFGGVADFTSGLALVGATSFGPPLWSYTFRADRDARLLFDYDVDLDEVLGGTDDGGFTFLFGDLQRIDLTAGMQGTLDFALAAGQTYTIGLRNIIAGFQVRGNDRFSAGYGGLFQWSIEDLSPPTAVPEPAILPLAMLALCAAALARRRQRGARALRPLGFASPRGPAARTRDAVRRWVWPPCPSCARIGDHEDTRHRLEAGHALCASGRS